MDKKEIYWWLGIVFLIGTVAIIVLMVVFRITYLWRVGIVTGALAGYLLTWKDWKGR